MNEGAECKYWLGVKMLFVGCIVRVSVLIVLGSCYSLLTIILRNVDNTQRYSTALMIVFGVSWTAQCALSDWSKTELCTAVVETLHCCCSCRCRSTDTGHKIPGMGGWGGFSHLADLNPCQSDTTPVSSELTWLWSAPSRCCQCW